MAILLTIAYILTFPYILGFLTSDQQVIAKAYDYQIFVYALPIISVWCFWLDGVFTGLLRTRDMRNTMVLSVGIYLITAYLATYFNNYILFSSLLLLFILRALTLAYKLFKH
jgi:MATE family multidrug resistance protein